MIALRNWVRQRIIRLYQKFHFYHYSHIGCIIIIRSLLLPYRRKFLEFLEDLSICKSATKTEYNLHIQIKAKLLTLPLSCTIYRKQCNEEWKCKSVLNAGRIFAIRGFTAHKFQLLLYQSNCLPRWKIADFSASRRQLRNLCRSTRKNW